MPLTEHSDVFASFHEKGFNSIIQHIMLQRPSMFNYATEDFAQADGALKPCQEIKVHQAVTDYANPIFTEIPYIPVLGYNGPYGFSFCLQLVQLLIDFHPSNVISLPPELNPPLGAQQVAFTAKACAGLGCPDQRFLDKIAEQPFRGDNPNQGSPKIPFPFQELNCFCLELCAILRIYRDNTYLKVQFIDLEIKDIRPEGLENTIECYLNTFLRLTVFPKIKIALSDLALDLAGFISISPTPISGDVPFNPSISNDKISVFFNLS